MNAIIEVKNVTEAAKLLEVGKPRHPLVAVIHHSDVNFKKEYDNTRYVLDLYQISLKDGIIGSLGYGRNSYDFQDGAIIFTSPGQVISTQQKKIEGNITGWSIYFHPDLLRKSPLGRNISDYSFFSYDVHEALHVSDEEKESLTEIVGKIEKEINQNIDRHSQKLIIANIELLLDYCTRYYDRQFYTRSNLNKDLVTRFEQLLQEYYSSQKQDDLGVPTVQYCGEQLGMSSNYLSDLLKKETGRTALDHIHFFLIEKAKTVLLNSKDSVSSIAYDLGFEYPQYFSKLFRTKTGLTPTEYRRVN